MESVYAPRIFGQPDVLRNFQTFKCRSHALKLPDSLNPLSDKNVDIIAVDAPSETTKQWPAVKMLQEAYCAGKINQGSGIIIPTSGNFGRCALRWARYYGVAKVVLVILTDTAPKKSETLQFHGAEIIAVPSGTIKRAQEEAQKNNWYLLNQYSDENNWKAHSENLGPQIWSQTEGKISVFAAAMGTCGTIIGVSKFLKKNNRQIFVLGVNLLPEEEVPGARDLARIKKDVSFPWQDNIDDRIEVGARDSYRASFDLCRQAYLKAGPTSGTAYFGLCQFLLQKEAKGELDGLRNKEGRVVAVFPCPDGPEAYLEKYFTWLPASKLQY